MQEYVRRGEKTQKVVNIFYESCKNNKLRDVIFFHFIIIIICMCTVVNIKYRYGTRLIFAP